MAALGPLPTFVGIGAPKAGTTWLYEMLDAHPDIGMSPRRKEVHFFRRHYDRGPDWYRTFFEGLDGCAAIGEFTTHYLYNPALSERIAESAPTIDKLIVLLRDPITRARSHWAFRVRVEGYPGTFEAFLDERPEAIDWGRYGHHLARLQPWIDRGALLALIYEEATADVAGTQRQLGAFLGVDPGRFPTGAGRHRRNARFEPRFGPLYTAAVRAGIWLRGLDLDPLVNALKRAGVKRLFEREGGAALPPMRPETARRLAETFGPDVDRLEALLGRDLAVWRDTWT
ncbi:sulfotransferase domain-containing protein [Rubrivirga sp. IMCC45206]|uniref:sulfotransferase domain-containing protein n=1 Tax=Rubrivirga sp. IMCC45206 TaxID=3391614 RepID=UPI00398FACA3